MTLGFSTRWPDKMGELGGQPTYFIQKIWNGLIKEHILDVYDEKEIHREYYRQLDKIIEVHTKLPPKLHTIRHGQRWKKGMKIHMVIHNRTKKKISVCSGVGMHWGAECRNRSLVVRRGKNSSQFSYCQNRR